MTQKQDSLGQTAFGQTSWSLADSKLLPAEAPEKVLEWCYQTYGLRSAIGTSLQGSGLAIIHMALSRGLYFPVFIIDTGLLFEETLHFKKQIEKFFGIVIEVLRPRLSVNDQAFRYGEKLWTKNPDLCCNLRKVAPLYEKLGTLDAWITGVRRDQTPERQTSNIIEKIVLNKNGSSDQVVKINPLLEWTADEVETYLRANNIPTNPLCEKGYASIGCYPCTKPIADGANLRDGRWAGFSKKECGIHLLGRAKTPPKSNK